MNWLRLFLIVSILFWQAESPNCVVAEVSKVEKMNMCTNYVEELTAALSVEDWAGLERIAKKGIQNCKEVYNSDSYSGYYESLAKANIEQNKLMDALGACEKCIDIFYKNAGCHCYKMLVLVKLGKKSEAQNQFKITDRLVNYLIVSGRVKMSQNWRFKNAVYNEGGTGCRNRFFQFRHQLVKGFQASI